MTNFLPPRFVTGEQIRAARAMLRLDQKQFATLTHVTVSVIRRMERTRGPIAADAGMLEAMRLALEEAGVELIEAGHYVGIGGPGVRMRGEPLTKDDVIDFEEAVEELTMQKDVVPDAS